MRPSQRATSPYAPRRWRERRGAGVRGAGVDDKVAHPYKRRASRQASCRHPPPKLRFQGSIVRQVMANTKSAKKAARQSTRRTVINKSRRTRLRSAVRKVEEAIAAGDRSNALAAMAQAEPAIIRAAQKTVVHRNAARRKVSRLAHRIAKLAK